MGGHRRVNRTFHKGQVLNLTIEEMAFGGKGIARIETEKGPFVVFVQNAFPGQTVEAQVVKCKSRHAECRLLRVVQRAEYELDLPYQTIPGAPYATVPLQKQHKWKESTALDLYRRIGHVDNVDELYQGLVPSPLSWHYRNKMEYSFPKSAMTWIRMTKSTILVWASNIAGRGGPLKILTLIVDCSMPWWRARCTKFGNGAKTQGFPHGTRPNDQGFFGFWW